MSATTNPETLGHALRQTPPHLVQLVREDGAEFYQARGETLAQLAEERRPADAIRSCSSLVSSMMES